MFYSRSAAPTIKLASRGAEPTLRPIRGSLTEQFALEPMSAAGGSTGCTQRSARHSVCAGTVGIPAVPRRSRYSSGAGGGIGIGSQYRATVEMVGEADRCALTAREGETAVVDFPVSLGDDRAEHREARALAKWLTPRRSGGRQT